MCVPTLYVIQQVIGNATLHSISFSHMNGPQKVYDLTLFLDMRTQEGPKKHVNFHFIGTVHLRNGTGSDKRGEAIAFRNNTLNTNIRGMTLESISILISTWKWSLRWSNNIFRIFEIPHEYIVLFFHSIQTILIIRV